MKVAGLCALFAAVSAHAPINGKNLRVWQQRKSYCTILSFNQAKRNPSPSTCERTARAFAKKTCDYAQSKEIDTSGDPRCLGLLNQINEIRLFDCEKDTEHPLFVRIDCPRFGNKKFKPSAYDLIAAIPYLNPQGAPNNRLQVGASDYSYFDNNYWVFEREVRCTGLLATGVVPFVQDNSSIEDEDESQVQCTDYYNQENDSVCNYLKTIFDDIWDLGCVRVRKTILDVAKLHCIIQYNVQLADSQEIFCNTKGQGEDVSCDAVELICGSSGTWTYKDMALAPYFLNDDVIEELLVARRRDGEGGGEVGELLASAYTEGPDNYIDGGKKLLPSLDYLTHALHMWRPEFSG